MTLGHPGLPRFDSLFSMKWIESGQAEGRGIWSNTQEAN